MSNIKSSIIKVFRASSETFRTYPASIGCALAFTIVTMVRIQLDWPEQEVYNFLFNCLHLAFALGAIFSLASITAAKSRSGEKKSFLYANLLGIAATILAFILLYAFGGREASAANDIVTNVTDLAVARISVAIVVSLVAFIYLAGFPKEESDLSRSLFMFHKAFFIAAIYGAVIMSGTSGVAGAVQGLLFRDMSEKVYMYLGTLTGFLAFTIFVGYFPDFTKGKVDMHREVAQKQPKFIEVLFQYIMVPIALALTAVLLLWTGKTVISGTWPSFMRLSGIAASYAAIGIWLHILVTHHKSGMTQFFKRIYPVAALLILAFEARALILQLRDSGLKMPEYYFALTWVLAVVVAVLLLIKKEKAHPFIAALICAVTIFAVLPVVGYHALPVRAQVSRLESMLVSQNMLEDGQLVPAAIEPELSVREDITDAVEFLVRTDNANLPSWFDQDLSKSEIFEVSMGFEETWPERDPYVDYSNERVVGTHLTLPNGALDISDYTWGIFVSGYGVEKEGAGSVVIEGERGLYHVTWDERGEPTLLIELDDRVILEQEMKPFLNELAEKYPNSNSNSGSANRGVELDADDLSLLLETQEVTILVIFRNVSVNIDIQKDEFIYWTEISMIYMKENELADPDKIINFEDQVFEMAIRDCFDLDEGDITWKDIGYRTVLDSDDFQPEGRIKTLEDLKWFVNLQKIEMQEYEIEGDLSSFSHLESLEVLLMWETDVSGDLSSLSGLEKLRAVNLNHTDVKGDISSLSTLVNLVELELKETDVEGDINSLNGLKHLKFIELSDTNVTGR